MSDNASAFFEAFSTASSELGKGPELEDLGKFFGGSADFGKGLVYMFERIQETLKF